MKSYAACFIMLCVTVVVQAQQPQPTPERSRPGNFKIQLYTGISGSTSYSGDTGKVVTGGAALVLPIGKKFVVKNFFTGSRVFPPNNGISFPQFQLGSMLGYKYGPWTFYGGAGESFQFKPTGTVKLPGAFFGPSVHLKGRWSALFPMSANAKGIGYGVQLAAVF